MMQVLQEESCPLVYHLRSSQELVQQHLGTRNGLSDLLALLPAFQSFLLLI
uniref:BRCA1-associated protein n=1 Tax=Arundo donax TaxID=35708 RepID=A0A0A9FC58_ARUDO